MPREKSLLGAQESSGPSDVGSCLPWLFSLSPFLRPEQGMEDRWPCAHQHMPQPSAYATDVATPAPHGPQETSGSGPARPASRLPFAMSGLAP